MEIVEVVNQINFMLNTAKFEKDRKISEPIFENGIIWRYTCDGCNLLPPQGCNCTLAVVLVDKLI